MSNAKQNTDEEPLNCQVCGFEHKHADLHSIKLAGFNSVMKICDRCKSRNPEQHYLTAATIVQNINKIAQDDISPEDRLEKIRNLLGK